MEREVRYACVVLEIILLSAQLIALYVKCVRAIMDNSDPDLIKQASHSGIKLLRTFWPHQAPADEFSQTVAAFHLERRFIFMRVFFRWAAVWSNCLAAWMVVKTVSGMQQWGTPGMDIGHLLCSACAGLAVWFPGVVRVGSLEPVFLASMGLLLFIELCAPFTQGLLIGTVWAVFRVCFGLFGGNMRLVTVTNLIYTLSVVFKDVYFPSDCECARIASFIIVIWEFSTLVSVVLGVGTLKQLMEAESRLTIESQTARDERSAATALLETICDAVVELNGSLDIVGPTTKFACLVRNTPHLSLDGNPFEHYVAERDRSSLAENLAHRPSVGAQRLANVFHLHLLDGYRNQIGAEVFHVPITRKACRADQSERHLLGIREYGDEGPMRRDFRASLVQPSLGGGEGCDPNTSSVGEPGRTAASGMDADLSSHVDPIEKACSPCDNNCNAPQCPAEANCECCDQQRQVLTVIFDPRTNRTRWQCPYHTEFWGKTVEAEAEPRAAYSLCVETFLQKRDISSMEFRLKEVWRVNSQAKGLRGPRAECEIKLKKETSGLDESHSDEVVITAEAIVFQASLLASLDGDNSSLSSKSSSSIGRSGRSRRSGRSGRSGRTRGSSHRRTEKSWKSNLEAVAENAPSVSSSSSSGGNLVKEYAGSSGAPQPQNVQHCSSEGADISSAMSVSFEPKSCDVIDVCAGLPPRSVSWSRPAHFWTDIGHASANVRNTFSKCVDIFECHPALKYLKFHLNGVRCVGKCRPGHREENVRCKMVFTRRAGLPSAQTQAIAMLIPDPSSAGAEELPAQEHDANRSNAGHRLLSNRRGPSESLVTM